MLSLMNLVCIGHMSCKMINQHYCICDITYQVEFASILCIQGLQAGTVATDIAAVTSISIGTLQNVGL